MHIGGGDIDVNGKKRCPDLAIRPHPDCVGLENPILPRGIIELDVFNRSLPESMRLKDEYFNAIDLLRFCFIIKVMDRRGNGNYAALAILYRRRNGMPTVADAVSFGTDFLTEQTSDDLPLDVRFRLRELPHPPSGENFRAANPWTAADRAWIRIPAADIYFLRDGAPGAPPQMIAEMPAGAADWDLDLWRVIRWVDFYL